MSKGDEREAAARIADLEEALRAIGAVLSDTTITPRRRCERGIGIVSLYAVMMSRHDSGERP